MKDAACRTNQLHEVYIYLRELVFSIFLYRIALNSKKNERKYCSDELPVTKPICHTWIGGKMKDTDHFSSS